MSQSEDFAPLLATIAKFMAQNECGSTRFALTVWCPCANVFYCASNDLDLKHAAEMLHSAADKIERDGEFVVGEVAGHA